MDKIDKNSDLFRSIPVHSQKLGVKWGFFRSIPVHFFSDHERDDAFPEHIRSFNRLAYTKVMRRPMQVPAFLEAVSYCVLSLVRRTLLGGLTCHSMFIAIFQCSNYYCIANYSLCLFVQPRLNGS